MSRTIKQLYLEAKKLGIDLRPKYSVEEVQEFLAQKIWDGDNPGVKMPEQFKVMLARDASKFTKQEFSKMFDNENWAAELKVNGCRGIMVIESGKLTCVHSRRRSDVHHRYEEKADNLPQFKNYKWNVQGLTVLDGELVHERDSIITMEGTKTENQLQTSVAMLNSESSKGIEMQKKYGNLQYWAFDILFLNGKDLRGLANSERRKFLEDFILKQNNDDLILCPRYEFLSQLNGFYDLFKKLVDNNGVEGIMLKQKSAPYISKGRPKTMYKMKRFVTYDAFITGFVPSNPKKGFANLIGAFEVSAFIDGKQRIIGAVSSMDLETRKDATLHGCELDGVLSEIKPVLAEKYLGRIMEVKGQEVSKNGRLAHCEMIQWRPDKRTEDCQILGSLYYGKS